jgi:2-polyprenyl-3-methyl-5-hydroxy-6-metoxy-1,4-benzoquinol methylase
VRERRIESRRAATDAAIREAVLDYSPRSALDLGCGEGWLVRALADHGVSAVGVDASPPLVEAASSQGGGTFHLSSYDEIGTAPEVLGTGFDAAIFNFSLLDEDAVPILRAVHRLLAPTGAVFIQTVHPWTACDDEPYANSWRVEKLSGASVPASANPCHGITAPSNRGLTSFNGAVIRSVSYVSLGTRRKVLPYP